MKDNLKLLSDILNNKLSEDIDENTVNDIAGLIRKCEDCLVNVDSIKQTIKLARTGDFEVLLPKNVSKRLFEKLGLEEE